jgi:glycerol-3-phosphate dehydrogenase (NAD(P)+)
MKIGYLGQGSFGYCLSLLLASKGYEVISWTTKQELADNLNNLKEHPFLPGYKPEGNIRFTTNLEEALKGIDLLVESVTSAGVRPVFERVKAIKIPDCPIVLTSKGIEQNSGKILPEVILEVLGVAIKQQLALLSGPSYASEVIKKLPTSVVGTAYDHKVMMFLSETFQTNHFRVYPNSDIIGVAYGGALKNIIAIACGIAEGLGSGNSAKAALMTRGLHEIKKLAIAKGALPETLNGLSGMGDLCVTCSSPLSRNYRFGLYLAQGLTQEDAKDKIQMVVEGAYTASSALLLAKNLNISMPITETVYKIIYEGMPAELAVKSLMQRAIKEEHL